MPRDHIDGAVVQYDYTNQAWLYDGVYQKCGHLECEYVKGYVRQCYGSKHEGEGADPDANIQPTAEEVMDLYVHTTQERVPCPYDPTPLLGQPIGCPLCGEMVLAGLPHS